MDRKVLWWDAREYSEAAKAYLGISAHNTDPTVSQTAYRWGTPGTESAHGWEAAENIALTLAEDGNGNYALFLRIEIDNPATSDQNDSKTYKLQYRVDTGGGFGSWTDVTASSADVQVVADSNITDGATVATNRLTTSTETFSGVGQYDEGDGTLDTFTVTKQASMELLWSLQIIDADMADGDDLEFRVVESDNTLLNGTYDNTPALTWNAAAASGTNLLSLLGVG